MTERYRYYLTMRPPGIGCQPNKGLERMHAFDRAEKVDCIGRWAWGWVEYSRPLTCDEIRDFELVRGNVEEVEHAEA